MGKTSAKICWVPKAKRFINKETRKFVSAETARRAGATKSKCGKKKKPCSTKGKTKKMIAGKMRCVHTGPQGGKYYVKGKSKVYIK